MASSLPRAALLNRLVSALVASRLGFLVRGGLTVVTYTGRRSGRVVSTPVGYRRRGGGVVEIPVGLPERKTWWRNFTGAGAPLSLQLDGSERRGHAVATRDARGRVVVTVTLAR